MRTHVKNPACPKLCAVETQANGLDTTLHKRAVLTGRTGCIDVEQKSWFVQKAVRIITHSDSMVTVDVD